MIALIVFSHLRWNFVYQRPQHVLSRIARRWPVIFVEEPVHDAGEPRLEVEAPCEGVTVLRPRTPVEAGGFHDTQMPAVQALLDAYLAEHAVDDYAVWLYTPMALPLLAGLAPRALVFDCMDELSAFHNSPPQLLAREATLLRVANVVFTGGPSLYHAKRARNPNVHCMPSSVDLAHFARGRDASLEHPALAGIAHPRLGFYGVIDERLDIGLVAALADAQPDWQVCLVGPVVKIDPAQLPQRPNLHYVPQLAYDELPAMLAGWDVCLLPFAHNESTQFISPTKTLEYMAAEKPVVSTAVRDVVTLYGTGVRIGDGDEFIEACRAALAEGPVEAQSRIDAQRTLVEATSWDATAARMVDEIERAMADGLTPAAREWMAAQPVVELPRGARDARGPHVGTLVVGAGPTGLSAAYHLGKDSLLVEANATVGGWCRSIEDSGFTFDYAGHIMFSNDPYVLGLYETLLGDNLHWQDREAWVYSKGVHTRYPFQGALYGLPPKVLKDCIVGAVEARFGALDGSGAVAPPRARAAAERPATPDCCADGTAADEGAVCAEGDVKDAAASNVTALYARRTPRNFEEFIYQVWGKGVAEHFAMPYNRKIWTVPPREMETSWLGGRVPMPDLEQMIEGALEPVAKPMGPNARFGYPLRGGFQALMDGFLPLLEGELRLSTRLVKLDTRARVAYFDDGSRVRYDSMISTMPLPALVALVGDEAPAPIHAAARALRHASVRCVNLGIGRESLTDKHWIYYPEDTVFHRIFVQGNASPHCNPPGGFGLTCEITYSPTKPLPCDGDALIERCIAECRQVGMLREDDVVLTANLVDMPYAYVIYDHARKDSVERIRQWMLGRGIVLSGRYSEWEYYNSDHAFIAGRNAAEAVRGAAALADAPA